MNNRRKFLSKAVAVGSAAILPLAFTKAIAQAADESSELPSLKGRKVLFVYGGWPGHDPLKFKDYLVPWLQEEGAEVVVHDKLDPYADKALMDTIDLVIQTMTMSQMDRAQERGLLDAVKNNGTAMAGWHGGMCDAFRNNTEYQFMTGGQWVAHPGNVVDYTVEIIDDKDGVTKGMKNFSMHSEQYYMHVDPNVKVLATTKFNGNAAPWIDGATMPVTWKKMYGKGRIFYTSLGHNVEHLTNAPQAVDMLKRGIKWASASKYLPAEKWMSPVYK